MQSRKPIRIGLDLDGVLVDKPPFVPKKLLEWLVRSHQNKNLAYRFPQTKLEQRVRIFSHHPIFRPPIKESLDFVKKLTKEGKYKLYLISGRYSFLKKRTSQWLQYHQIKGLFEKVFINLDNEQPHLFKEKMIKKLKLDVFVDDDLPLTEYLANSTLRVEIFCFDRKKRKQSLSSVTLIESLGEIFSK